MANTASSPSTSLHATRQRFKCSMTVRTLNGREALDRQPLHEPPVLRPPVVERRQVLQRAVVPHQNVVRLPAVNMAEARLDDAVRELLDERQRSLRLHAFDGDAF